MVRASAQQVSNVYDMLMRLASLGPERVEAERLAGELESGCGEAGNWEGYVEVLVSVADGREQFETMGRLMAVICLKNVARRKWRAIKGRNASNAVSDGEKTTLRNWLTGHALSEPDRQVAAQIVDVLRKVARQDWPRSWPNVLSDVIATQASLSAPALRAVVKELASKRLPYDRRAFEQAGELELFPIADTPSLDGMVDVLGIVAARCSNLPERLLDRFFEACARLLRSGQRQLEHNAAIAACDGLRGYQQRLGRYMPTLATEAVMGLLAGEGAEPAKLELAALALDHKLLVDQLVAPLADFCFRHLPTSQAELEEWASDPEEYALRDEGDDISGDYNARELEDDTSNPADAARVVRAKCENVLLAIADDIVPTVCELAFGVDAEAQLASCCSQHQHHPEMIAARDGALRAAGVLAFAIPPTLFDFTAWCARVAMPALAALREQRVFVLSRRLYWLMRCFSHMCVEGALGRALRDTAATDASTSADIAVRVSALDVLDCLFAPEEDDDAQLVRTARAALEVAARVRESDHVAKALNVASRAAAALLDKASVTTSLAAVADDLSRSVLTPPNGGGQPAALSALADAVRVAVRCACQSFDDGIFSSVVIERAPSLVDALLDASRDPELCCAPSACDLWLEILRRVEPAVVPRGSRLRQLGMDRLGALCAHPRDLSLAVHCARLVRALLVLGWPLDLERAISPLVSQVSEKANAEVDAALELAAALDRSRGFLLDTVAPTLLADVKAKAGHTTDEHLSVLCRLAIIEPARFTGSELLERLLERRASAKHTAALAALHLFAADPTGTLTRLHAIFDLVADAHTTTTSAMARLFATPPKPVGDGLASASQDFDHSAVVVDVANGGTVSSPQYEGAPLDTLFEANAVADPVRNANLAKCARDALNAAAALVPEAALNDALADVEPSVLATLQLSPRTHS